MSICWHATYKITESFLPVFCYVVLCSMTIIFIYVYWWPTRYHISWSCCLVVTTWRMKQELLTLPEHLNSHPCISGIRVAQSLIFCIVFCSSLFVCFLLAIMWFVLLRLMASDSPLGYLETLLIAKLAWVTKWKRNSTTLSV